MKKMRYINLLDRISHVKTMKCFTHNNAIFFAVRRSEVSKAIGPNAVNMKKMQESLGSRVKVIREPDSIADAKNFIEDIVSPLKVRAVEVKEDQIIITAGSNQNKAVLIGRNKRRLDEMQRILRDFFHKDLKVI